MACSHHGTEWFQVRALDCIGLALRAKDPRIKQLCVLEAERWLRLNEMGRRAADYRGAERRMTPRHQRPKAGVILLERAFRVECMVRDFSPAGIGLLLPETIILPDEFHLTFDHAVRRCITVWRRVDRMGVKFKSIARASAPGD
jgi:hypothetical protein